VQEPASSTRLGVDIGGTFTDLAAVLPGTGQVLFAKVLSTPEDSSLGVQHAAEKVGLGFGKVGFFIHGTTVGTNTVLERKGARVGLLTTRGFRDVLEIARTDRPEVYGLHQDKFGQGQPDHLVPRYLRLEVDERVRYTGEVERPLDERSAVAALRELLGQSVEALAVSLLHAYANPAHERALQAIAEREAPGLPLSISSDICPEVREYERTSTTVVNAYLMPVVARYLARLDERIRARGYQPADYFVMSSSGGVISSRSARIRPIATLESGPAAGVIAATAIGKRLGIDRLISFDMGGTTAKAGLVEHGMPKLAGDFKVATEAGHILRRGPGGGGYAVKMPMTDLAEVGVGGGSVAWMDAGGGIKVGPRSAGAHPGPACYGLGGTHPTVTDADLVLGRVNPRFFAGGELRLDMAASQRAFRERLGTATGLDTPHLAWGVVEVADEGMIQAIRAVSVERGYDPREYAMLAFGSAAPQHAARIAEELGVPRVIVPTAPGCMSAFGLLVADLRYDFTHAVMRRLTEVEPRALQDAVEALEAQGVEALNLVGALGSQPAPVISAELRYEGQSWELNVPVAIQPFSEGALERLKQDFEAAHRAQYGYHLERGNALLVSLRVSVGVPQPPFPFPTVSEGGPAPAEAALKEVRQVCLDRRHGYQPTAVYDRALLAAHNVVCGPALVEEVQSTTVVPRDWQVTVEPFGNLVLEPRRA
jgi:N-methylhydantoinase A